MQDSLSISVKPVQTKLDTLTPLYIFKDSTVANADTDMDYGFMEYTTQTLGQYLPEPVLEESLLKEKTYYITKPLKLHEREVQNSSQNWTFSILILFFAVIAIGFKFFKKRCVDIVHSCLSLKSFEILTKTSNPLVLISSFLIIPILGLLAYAVASHWFVAELNQIGELKFYCFSLLAILLFFFIKILLIKFCGLLFRCNQQVNMYITNLFVYLGFASVLMFLPVFASLFALDSYKLILMIISASIFVLITIIRALRGLYIIIKFPKFFNVYLFCYLCTLEIVPLLFLYRSIF
ncbi:MAG: DUF4271 domain-containing protein [Bacteroidales bacterium]|nr:DUF4271 domain-containing protein [Bacteroidales bacterium]